MSDFKIGGSPFRPAPSVSNGKKPEVQSSEIRPAPSKGEFDSINFRANRLAVMPRISAVGGQSAQHVKGEAVESLLKDSAPELDDYFSKAYGFDEEPE